MSNVKSNLHYAHQIVNLKNKKEIEDMLYHLLCIDNDLSDNIEFFREDTYDLGFINEADRIVREALEKHYSKETNIKQFTKLCDEVFKKISSQDFFGDCESNYIEIDGGKVSTIFIIGGKD